MDDTQSDNDTVSSSCDVTRIVTREEWGARPSKEINYMGTPVGYVFIHHTSMKACQSKEEGIEEMKKIQDFHMDDRGWDDIGYNFLIGEDGNVYEGRAWDRIGAHTLSWNDVAIAFSIMGDFSDKLPTKDAIQTLRTMLDYGVKLGKIKPDYKVHGHRDVRDTECPGDQLYDYIRTWDHFSHDIPPIKPSPIPYKPEERNL